MLRTLALLAVVITASCASALTGIQDTALRLEFDNGGVCSGTAVAANVLLSADHCWNDSARLMKINGEEAHALKIERDGQDHVLVRVSTKFKRHARMGPEPALGDRIRWLGQPAAQLNVYRQSYVIRTDGESIWFMDGYHGDSGAGVFDDHNRLVAVVSSGRRWQARTGHSFQVTVALPIKFTPEQWRAIQ